MSEVISLDGMRELKKMQREGIALPENYPILIQNYLKIKMSEIAKWEAALEKSKQQFIEAIKIAEELGVKW